MPTGVYKRKPRKLITKTCPCGVEFKVWPYREKTALYCSRECQNKYKPPIKPWAQEERECPSCGKKFSKAPWELRKSSLHKGIYCSRDCAGKGRRGSAASNWLGGDKEARCEWCGVMFSHRRSKNLKRKFCSVGCRGAYAHAYKAGANSHSYIDGHSERKNNLHLGHAYRQWRRKVMERFDACVRCGKQEGLHADHINPVAIHPDLAFDVENGQALCSLCHKAKTKSDWAIICAYRRKMFNAQPGQAS